MRDNSRLIARRVRLLESELLMLQNYLKECSLLFDQYQKEYNSDILYFIDYFSDKSITSKNTQEPPQQHSNSVDIGDPRVEEVYEDDDSEAQEKEVTQSSDKKHPSWAKALYRKIAMVTHPDKVKEDERKEKLEQQFQAASRALSENDYNRLVALALTLDLKSELGNKELVQVYKEQIAETKDRISVIEKSVEWIWGEGFGMSEVRSKILIAAFQKRNLIITIEEVEDAIRRREEESS